MTKLDQAIEALRALPNEQQEQFADEVLLELSMRSQSGLSAEQRLILAERLVAGETSSTVSGFSFAQFIEERKVALEQEEQARIAASLEGLAALDRGDVIPAEQADAEALAFAQELQVKSTGA